MSREIKFRAYSKSRNRYLGKGDTLIYRHEVGFDGSRWWASLVERQDHTDEDIIVEQYTGLKDKNGISIYEGDLVRNCDKCHVDSEEVDVVRVTDDAYLLPFRSSFGSWSPELCEVIGNIHEPPKDFSPEHLKRMGISINKGGKE